MEKLEWTHVLLPLLTLALQFEREGQYSLAKLARASVDALGRRAAFENERTLERAEMVAELERVTDAFAGLQINKELISAFRHGAAALSEGRLALIHQTPHPYVRRTWGQIVMGEVQEKCPTCGAWPDTFQWFAPIYWLDALDPLESIAQLRRMPQAVAHLLDRLPERAFERQPQDGGWDLRNILTHLRDAQGVLIYRLELFLREEHPVLISQAIFEWATQPAERPPSVLDIFTEYREARAELLTRLEALPLADWWRTDQHEEFGVVSIKQQVSYFASHDFTHLPQLQGLCK